MNLDQMFLNVLNRSVIAGLLVLVILVLRLLLKKAPKWICCVLWVLVALRLIVPLGIVSRCRRSICCNSRAVET